MRSTGCQAADRSDQPTLHPAIFLPLVGAYRERLGPEQRLMLAVLEDTVSDFQAYATAYTRRGRRIFLDADAWFRSGSDGPFAFETICHATGLDAACIRDGLRRWYDAHHRPQRAASAGGSVSVRRVVTPSCDRRALASASEVARLPLVVRRLRVAARP